MPLKEIALNSTSPPHRTLGINGVFKFPEGFLVDFALVHLFSSASLRLLNIKIFICIHLFALTKYQVLFKVPNKYFILITTL